MFSGQEGSVWQSGSDHLSEITGNEPNKRCVCYMHQLVMVESISPLQAANDNLVVKQSKK